MSVALASIPDTANAADAQAPRTDGPDRALAILGQLAEIGLIIAQSIERQVTDGDIPPANAAVAYGRVARAVRLTIALQSKLIAEARTPAPDRQREERRTRIKRIVGRVVDLETLDLDDSVHQKREAADRLEYDDIYGDLLARPASEIVAQVCRDLGLRPDWTRLAAEAWAQEEIAAGAPGAPLTGDLDNDDGLDDFDDFGDDDDGGDDDDAPHAASP